MEGYTTGWNKPEELLKLRKMKTKKRALQDRLFDESPSKKSKRGQGKAKKLFRAQPPPPDEATCEDSTLMDLISMKQPMLTSTVFNTSTGDRTPSSCLSASLSPSPSSSSSMSPLRSSIGHSSSNSQGRLPHSALLLPNVVGSPMKSYLPSLGSLNILSTPPSVEKKRQRITPAPAITSPVWGAGGNSVTPKTARRGLDLSCVEEEPSPKDVWHKELCMDWSVKTKVVIKSESQFGWNSVLKTSEESSGISAFVRCIDMEPSQNVKTFSPPGSQLDTSLGAQFHQCCLYWQHPYLPTVKLFPREVTYGISSLSATNTAYAGNLRLEEKALDTMFLEWVDSFRSAFQLLRTRQCPYFYIFGNQFTCLFSAAGTQGLEYLQIYVTPSTRSFRESLKKEGIDFTLPYYEPNSNSEAQETQEQTKKCSSKDKEKELDSDDEPDRWLDEMGISQDLSVSMNAKSSPTTQSDEKGKSTLLMITGDSSLAFFNFLINSKHYLVCHSGIQAGLPPTIIAPIAFQGASLRSLTVKQCRTRKSGLDDKSFRLELLGPILPHTLHMLCSVLNKTVKNYEIGIDTMQSTVPININSSREVKTPHSKHNKPNAFDVQNLSDCGTKRSLLEMLCRSDIIDTIGSRLECQELRYKWS